MAAFVEVFGFKKVTLISMATLLIGSIFTLLMNQAWHLILRGFIMGLGVSIFLTVVNVYVSNYWFEKRRGLVSGILSASMATGQLVLLPVMAAIIDNHSWRHAVGLLIALNFIMLIINFLFLKNKPEDIGILPYGHENTTSVAEEVPKENPFVLALNGLLNAVKVKEFWLLVGSFFICGLSTNGLIGTHFIVLFVKRSFFSHVALCIVSRFVNLINRFYCDLRIGLGCNSTAYDQHHAPNFW